MRANRGLTGRLVLAVVAGTVLLAACAEPERAPVQAPTATVTPSPAASATASTPTASPTSSRTPVVSPSPSVTSTAPAGPTPPAGYAQSCAKDVRWGVQVTQPFLCLDAPEAGTHVARGGTVTVRGWAGGSFENNVVLEIWSLDDRNPKTRLVQVPVTYVAPDIGMPGGFQRAITVPASTTAGQTRIIAHFDSPRDGSVVRSASVDIVVD